MVQPLFPAPDNTPAAQPVISAAPPEPAAVQPTAPTLADTRPAAPITEMDVQQGAAQASEPQAFRALHALRENRLNPGKLSPEKESTLKQQLQSYVDVQRAHNRPLFPEQASMHRAAQVRRATAMLGGLDKLSEALPADKFQELETRAKLSPDPDGYRARVVNRNFLDLAYGKKVKPEHYEKARDYYAKKILKIEGPLDDKGFYGALQARQQKQRATDDHLTKSLEDVFGRIAAGESPDINPFLADFRNTMPDVEESVRENYEDELRRARRQYRDLRRQVEPLANALTPFVMRRANRSDAIPQGGFGPQAAEPQAEWEAAQRFNALTPEQQAMVGAIIEKRIESMPEDQRGVLNRAFTGASQTVERLGQGTADWLAAQAKALGQWTKEEDRRGFVNAVRQGDVKTAFFGSQDPRSAEEKRAAIRLRNFSASAGRVVKPSDNWFVRSGILFSEQLPYTAAMFMPGGTALLATSMAGNSYTDSLIARPDADPAVQLGMATISGGAQAEIERRSFGFLRNIYRGNSNFLKFMTGKYGTASALNLAKVTDRFARAAVGGAVGVAGITAAEYGEEIAQDATDAALQDLATELSGLDSTTDYWALLRSWDPRGEKGRDTILALLPLALIGGAGASARHFKHGKWLMKNEDALKAVGVSPEKAREIAYEPDLSIAEPKFVEEFAQNLDAQKQKAAADAFGEYLQGARELARAAGYELIQEDRGFAGDQPARWLLRLPNEEFSYHDSPEAAEQALLEAQERELESSRDAVLESLTSSMVDFLKEEGRTGQDVQVTEQNFAGTFDEMVSRGMATMEQVRQRLEIYAFEQGLSMPQVEAQMRSGQLNLRIAARAYSKELTNGSKKYFVDLFQGADQLNAAEDFSESHWSYGLDNQLFDAATAIGWLRATEYATGNRYLDAAITPQSYRGADHRMRLVEALSKASIQYLLGESRNDQLPEGFRGWIEQMVLALGKAWIWAKELLKSEKLRQAIEEGQIPQRFVDELADSVGLNDRAREQRGIKAMQEQAMAEMLAEFPKLSERIKGKLMHPETAREQNSPFAGELRRIYDHFVSTKRVRKWNKKGQLSESTKENVRAANAFFAPAGTYVDLDRLRESLVEDGFPGMETITDMLRMVEEVVAIDKVEYYATHGGLLASSFSLGVDSSGKLPGMTGSNENAWAELDQKYLAAVQAGDTKTTEKLADEGAKMAGLKIIFHGTPNGKFQQFDKERLGERTAGGSAQLAFFGSSKEEVAYTYANAGSRFEHILPEDRQKVLDEGMKFVKKLKETAVEKAQEVQELLNEEEETYGYPSSVNVSHLIPSYPDKFEFTKDNGEKYLPDEDEPLFVDSANEFEEILTNAALDIERDIKLFKAAIDKIAIMKFYLDIKNPLDRPFEKGETLTEYVKDAIENGHDGGVMRNIDDSLGYLLAPKADHWFFFNSEQAKSADPVTYDEQGNVIPLSQRFNPADDRISYSLTAVTGSPIAALLEQKATQGPQERATIMEGIRTRLQAVQYKREARESGMMSDMERQLQGWRARTDLMPAQRERLRIEDAMAEVKAILNAVPAEIRSKITVPMTRILDADTEKTTANAFAELIENLDDVLEQQLRADYTEAIENILNVAQPSMSDTRQMKGKLIVETNRLINRITEIEGLTSMEMALALSTAESTAKNLEEELDALAEDDTTARELVGKNLDKAREEMMLLYHFGKMDLKDSRELATSLKVLREIYTRGRYARQVIDTERRQWLHRMRQDVKNSLNAPRNVSGPTHAARTEKKQGPKGFGLNLMSIHNLLASLFPYSQFAADLSERLIAAQRNTTRARLAAKDRFESFLDTRLGTKNRRERNRIIRKLHVRRYGWPQVSEVNSTKPEKLTIEQAEKILAGEMKPGWENERDSMILLQQAYRDWRQKPARARAATKYVEITRVTSRKPKEGLYLSDMDALYLIQLSKQTEYLPAMETHGYTPQVMQEIRRLIDPQALTLGEFYAAEYEENWYEMNPVFQRLYHMDMPQIRNYAPGMFENSKDTNSVSGDPMGDGKPMSALSFGSTKNRRAHRSRPKQYSAHAVYMAHVDRSTYWANFAELARDMSMVLRETEVRRAIEAQHGMEASEEIKVWIDNINKDGAIDAAARLAMNVIGQKLVAAQSIIALAGNLGVPFKQFSAALGSVFKIGPTNAAKAFARAIFRPESFSYVWKSEAIQQRIREGFSPEDRSMLDAAELNPATLWELHQYSRVPTSYADALFTTISGVIAYDHHYQESIRGGMSEKQAHELAMQFMDRAVFLTSQPADTQTRSSWEIHAKGPAKLFCLFRSDPRKQLGNLIEQYAMTKQGRMSKADFAASVATQWLAYGALFYVGGALFRAIAHDDDDDRAIWDWKELIVAMLLGPVEGASYLGSAIQASVKITAAFLGADAKRYAESANPLVDMIERSFAKAKKIGTDKFDPYDIGDYASLSNAIGMIAALKNPLFALIPAALRGVGQVQDMYLNLNQGSDELKSGLLGDFDKNKAEAKKMLARQIDDFATNGTPIDQVPEEIRPMVAKARAKQSAITDGAPKYIQDLQKKSPRERMEAIRYLLDKLPAEERESTRAELRQYGMPDQ